MSYTSRLPPGPLLGRLASAELHVDAIETLDAAAEAVRRP